MYQQNDEDSVVTLGVPTKKPQAFKPGSLEGWEKATISKIGGYPVWHDPVTAPGTLNQLPTCHVCNSNSDIVLVCQIFAPTEVDRSLYVFCCNKRACSLQNKGWTVVRNQQIATVSSNQAVNEPSSPAPPTNSTPTIWNIIADDNDDDDDDDLLDLLKARNKSIATKPTPPPQPVIKPVVSEPPKAFLITSTALPICPLEEIDEDWDNRNDDDETESYAQRVDGSHIDKLIESYLNDEDDEDTLLALKASGMSINRDITPMKASKKVAEEEEDNMVDEDEEDKRAKKDLNKEKVEQYFLKRVSIEPKQVLRYAYEGSPLWISKPSPLDYATSDKKKAQMIPVCEKCGCNRVFECQLMPALLSYISPLESQSPSISTPTAEANVTSLVTQISPNSLADTLGDGIDFGVVTIWTCPNSCYVSHSSEYKEIYTEIAIVQQPPDFL